MSKYIDRDIAKVAVAAEQLGMTNIERDVTGPVNRWRFHLKATFRGETILMAFDPRQRPTGGTTKKQIRNFLAKRDWAESAGYYFYAPDRHHITSTYARHALQKWIGTRSWT